MVFTSFLIFCGLSCSVYGLYYIKGKYFMHYLGWKTLELYTNCETFYNTNIYNWTSSYFKTNTPQKKSNYVIHNTLTNKFEEYINIPDDIESNWIMMKNKHGEQKQYQIINQERGAVPSCPIKYKPFLQVELEQNNKRYDIQENLDVFFLEHNKILDNKFLMWYMNYYYNIILEKDYKLHIIDSNINLLSISPNQYIILEKNNYIIKDNKKK